MAGQKEGLEMLEMADPLVMLILLPAIPVGLICAGTLKWEDAVLLALRKTCRKVPALGLVLPFGE